MEKSCYDSKRLLNSLRIAVKALTHGGLALLPLWVASGKSEVSAIRDSPISNVQAERYFAAIVEAAAPFTRYCQI
jgi:hypothetical protein